MDTFHIVTIGPPEAGKTVYLAAMHHALGSSDVLGHGATATIEEHGARSQLRKLYSQICDPGEKAWPASTRSFDPMREYTFNVTVNWMQSRRARPSRLFSYPVLRVSYVDYAGEWVPDGDLHADELLRPFLDRVERADALVGVIDGVKLLQFMEGNPKSRSFLDGELRPVVEFMEGRGKPVHFIITKWDL